MKCSKDRAVRGGDVALLEEKALGQFAGLAAEACRLAIKRKVAADRIYWNQIRERIANH